MHKVKLGLLVAGALFTAGVGVAAQEQGVLAADNKTVTVGVVGDTARELWENIGQRAKKEYGITIKLKEFNDYVKPN
ncbi:hypothetical protein [Weissella cibaria]|uniref:hypothetical protein n=1 Tax=Weissella cibaria TaxID=137591 RepID=UPI0028F6E765|nr:hypothetical protein [Weissella cibaria]